jgi:hypothetical protein
LRKQHDLNDARERQLVIDEMLPIIAEMPNQVERGIWVSRIAGGRAREDDIWRRLRSPRRTRPEARTATPAPSEGPEGEEPSVIAPQPKRRRVAGEEFCLAMMYRMPEIAHLAADVDEELFSLSENRELFRRWREGEPVSEDADEDDWIRDHYREVLNTRLVVTETAQVEAAFLSCVALLEKARMRAVKEASALALAEGEAGVRPGQVASIALARLEAGSTEDAQEDAEVEEAVASLLLKDTFASLNLHRKDDQTPADPDRSGIHASRQTP